MSGVDAVIHAAWYMIPGELLFSEKNLDCMIGSIIMAKAAASSGVGKFIGLGTCFEYNLNTGNGVMTIDTPLKPESLYGATKASTYLSLSAYFSSTNTAFSWCRLFYLYGDGEDQSRLYSYIINKLEMGHIAELSSGNQIRDYMKVDDAAQKIIKILLGEYSGAQNICTGTGVSVREFCELVAAQYGRKDLLRFGMRQDNLIDPICVIGKPTV